MINQHRFSDQDDLDAFAVSDGFDNWKEMSAYRDFCYELPFSGDLILWGVHPMLAADCIVPAKRF